MKRAVIACTNPWQWIDQLQTEYSIMIVNPEAPGTRYDYLISNSDYSLLVTDQGEYQGAGNDHGDEKIFIYTSGTTGDSKFYGFTHQQVDTLCDTMIRSYNIGPDDRYFGIMPLWHAHGLSWYWATKKAKCDARFGSVHDFDTIERFQPTILSSIPKMLNLLAHLKLDHLRFMRSGSVAMPSKILNNLKNRFQIPIIEAFGMTESISHCFTNPLLGPQKPGTVGLPDGVEAFVDDKNHLWIQGPCLFQPGWFDTGDIAAVDQDGYYTIMGRHLDQININGIKINPASIENQIYEKFPDVVEVAIFGKDKLHCVYTGDVSEDVLRSWLISLGPHCRPKMIKKIASIPKNTVGKISRQDLEKFVF